TAKGGSPPTGVGYDPPGYRFSVGKVQPYAGSAFADPVTPGTTLPMSSYHFNTSPRSFVLAQAPNTPAGTPYDPAASTVPANTFGRHNGRSNTGATYSTAGTGLPQTTTETLMVPYDWLVHMDRPLT